MNLSEFKTVNKIDDSELARVRLARDRLNPYVGDDYKYGMKMLDSVVQLCYHSKCKKHIPAAFLLTQLMRYPLLCGLDSADWFGFYLADFEKYVDVSVKRQMNYLAVFEDMGIIATKRSRIKDFIFVRVRYDVLEKVIIEGGHDKD